MVSCEPSFVQIRVQVARIASQMAKIAMILVDRFMERVSSQSLSVGPIMRLLRSHVSSREDELRNDQRAMRKKTNPGSPGVTRPTKPTPTQRIPNSANRIRIGRIRLRVAINRDYEVFESWITYHS